MGLKKLLLHCLLLFLFACSNQNNKINEEEILSFEALNLIPEPLKIKQLDGTFQINNQTRISYDTMFAQEANYLEELITNQCNFDHFRTDSVFEKENTIQLNFTSNKQIQIASKEYFKLKIGGGQIKLEAQYPEGMMRGIQTLRQLFIPAFSTNEKRDNWYLSGIEIEDEPAFIHRGFMLDVCRHFFEKDVVLKYIDLLAYYKMNVLHLHLTEDQGWRLPIDKYPLLNEIASWRLDSNGNKYGGFYSKTELKEIVAYATERHITVIPEIELPGHAQAALAAYPQFSCKGGFIEPATDWGVFKEIYCAGNDSTFTFLEDILTEVMEIFPSKYIHIGGDEVPKFRWENCSKCQQRIKNEGLADEHALQSYFIKRISDFLSKNNRVLIGWDEIMEGGLDKNAVVQNWRGNGADSIAISKGNHVIMSPTSHCYLDYSLENINLEKIYSFNPLSSAFTKSNHQMILGGECNMWTEHVPDEKTLDSKVFPRLIAFAEVLWSGQGNRNYLNFYKRLQAHYPILSNFKVQFGQETIGSSISTEHKGEEVFVSISKNLADLNIKYRWEIEEQWNDYLNPFPLKKSGKLIVQAFKNNETYGDSLLQTFNLHDALYKPVKYSTQWSTYYKGHADQHLVDGELGSLDFRDGKWQGFSGKDIDVVIDLGQEIAINDVSANFYQYSNSWIFAPTEIAVYGSSDNKTWAKIDVLTNHKVDLSNVKSIYSYSFINKIAYSQTYRYLHFTAKNIGKVPNGHDAAGSEAWIFIDEITINYGL